MKVIEVLNIRHLYQDLRDVDFSDGLSIKISTFLNESEFVEIQYSEMELSLLCKYGIITEDRGFKAKVTEDGQVGFLLKEDTKDEFYENMTKVLASESNFHIDGDMMLTNGDIDEIIRLSKDIVTEEDIRKVLDPIRS